MEILNTLIEEVKVIIPKVFEDDRGWFMETYSSQKLDLNIDFIQDNHSLSKEKNVLRGLHFQKNPKAQTKLVRCTRGKILDIAVDLRLNSPTYLKWVSVELSEKNKKQLLIPKGFAHGFITLTENAEVQYKVDEFYSYEHDRSIKFDDKQININWGTKNPILSLKDLKAPNLIDSDVNFKIKVLVTGGKGLLASDLIEQLKISNYEVFASDIEDFDITNYNQAIDYVKKIKPDIIVHCAAYTAVDKAETDKEKCLIINKIGTENIAKIAKVLNCRLLYFSTDYVFDGTGIKPYEIDTITNPINYYGFSKEQGEKFIINNLEKYYIVRISWIYGKNGNNFVKKMLELSKNHKELRIVNDQIGSPTYTKDLSKVIVQLIKKNAYGIYHCVSNGYCSWYDFAKEIFEIKNINIKLTPVESSEYKTPAIRPKNSRLSLKSIKSIDLEMPSWQTSIRNYLKETNNE